MFHVDEPEASAGSPDEPPRPAAIERRRTTYKCKTR
jgi:hypothetical protein